MASLNCLLLAAFAYRVDQGVVFSSNCLTVNINPDCLENVTTGVFSIRLQYAFGNCRELQPSAYTESTTTLSAYFTCVPVHVGNGTGEFCYQATLIYQDTVTDTNLNFASCSIADLQPFLGPGVSYQLDGPVESGGNVTHLTTATLSCSSAIHDLSGTPQTTCTNGSWSFTEKRSCSSKDVPVQWTL